MSPTTTLFRLIRVPTERQPTPALPVAPRPDDADPIQMITNGPTYFQRMVETFDLNRVFDLSSGSEETAFLVEDVKHGRLSAAIDAKKSVQISQY